MKKQYKNIVRNLELLKVTEIVLVSRDFKTQNLNEQFHLYEREIHLSKCIKNITLETLGLPRQLIITENLFQNIRLNVCGVVSEKYYRDRFNLRYYDDDRVITVHLVQQPGLFTPKRWENRLRLTKRHHLTARFISSPSCQLYSRFNGRYFCHTLVICDFLDINNGVSMPRSRRLDIFLLRNLILLQLVFASVAVFAFKT